MRTPQRFLASLLNRPQLIEPAAGAAVLSVLAPEARLEGYDDEADNDAREYREYQVVNGIAVIPIIGELVHRGGSLRPVSGRCSYQAIADTLAQALADPSVSAILLDVDSPGGEAAGCLDFAERVRSMRGMKPLWGSINQRATSAAYAIVSACDRVLIGKDAHAGSIGVVSYHTDISKALGKGGIVVTYLYAGARKIDGVPALPLSDEARAVFQADIDAMYQRFCEVVAANRGLTVEAVRKTEAAIYRGEDAVRVGLADQISTMEEAIMALESKTAPSGARLSAPTDGPKMEDQTQGTGQSAPQTQPAQPAKAPEAPAPKPEDGPADPVAVAEACAKAGYADLVAPLLRSKASMTAVTARLAEAKAIADAGQRLRQPVLAKRLIAEGVSEASARAILGDAAAGHDESIVTDTTRSTAPAQAAPAFDHKAIYARMNGLKQG